MMTWKIKETKALKKTKLKSPVLIEGMPGIGNVGKIAADNIVEQLSAEKVMTFFSTCLPNSVFVKDDNMVEMPCISLHHKRIKGRDFLFLLGDVQPMEPKDSYEFTETILAVAKKKGCKEIIALGGIGLSEEPADSKVFCTGNDKQFINEFVKLGASNKLYGFVGPIMGVTGLLLGLSKKKGIKAVSLLAETYAHQMHIGFRESKGLMKILEKKYKFGLDIGKLEKEIRKFENELKPIAKQQTLQEEKQREQSLQDTTYIG